MLRTWGSQIRILPSALTNLHGFAPTSPIRAIRGRWAARPFLFSIIQCQLFLTLALAGCSGSPTAPTTIANPLLADARFDAAFYQMFALPLGTLRRQTVAPAIWVQTTDNQGQPIPDALLKRTGADALTAAQALTGERGSRVTLNFGTPANTRNTISVVWSATSAPDGACGSAGLAGDTVTLYYQTGGWCGCGDDPTIRPMIVKHEMGHALGFGHTDAITDLMHPGGQGKCDMEPSDREVFHARVAYSQPQGSR